MMHCGAVRSDGKVCTVPTAGPRCGRHAGKGTANTVRAKTASAKTVSPWWKNPRSSAWQDRVRVGEVVDRARTTATALRLRTAGVTWREISAQLEVNVRTLHRWTRKAA